MTQKEARQIADAINQTWRSHDQYSDKAYGIEAAVYTIADVVSERQATFSATDFKSRCFAPVPPRTIEPCIDRSGRRI